MHFVWKYSYKAVSRTTLYGNTSSAYYNVDYTPKYCAVYRVYRPPSPTVGLYTTLIWIFPNFKWLLTLIIWYTSQKNLDFPYISWLIKRSPHMKVNWSQTMVCSLWTRIWLVITCVPPWLTHSFTSPTSLFGGISLKQTEAED